MKCVAGIVSIVLLCATTSYADIDSRYLQGLGDSHYQTFESKIVGRSYHIFTMLPDGYDANDDKTYPTIYLLDGGALFPLLVAYYRYLNFADEMPESIIVGISYGSATFEGGNYRSADYTAKSDEREFWGGAEIFQSFLADELMPHIEKTYRSRTDRRIIFGQSIGGQFVLYTALTKPDLYWGHIASNPALHRNLPFFLDNHAVDAAGDVQSKLFVASASHDDPRYRVPAVKWIEYWSDVTERPWQLRTETLDGHSHMSAPPVSFRQGMRWLFSKD